MEGLLLRDHLVMTTDPVGSPTGVGNSQARLQVAAYPYHYLQREPPGKQFSNPYSGRVPALDFAVAVDRVRLVSACVGVDEEAWWPTAVWSESVATSRTSICHFRLRSWLFR